MQDLMSACQEVDPEDLTLSRGGGSGRGGGPERTGRGGGPEGAGSPEDLGGGPPEPPPAPSEAHQGVGPTLQTTALCGLEPSLNWPST